MSTASLDWALRHVVKYRDTDLFPRMFEFGALQRSRTEVFAALQKDSITNYPWSQGRRLLVPRGAHRFRAATQLDPVDTLVASALIYEIAPIVEAHRVAKTEKRVFSYRVDIGEDGRLYEEPSGWREFWTHSASEAQMVGVGAVLTFDIKDFYNQIYHHVIENELDAAGVDEAHAKALGHCFSRQSHSVSRGIPVGPHFTHLIAELCLSPIDRALLANGIEFCRYADDFHVFVPSDEDPDAVLEACTATLDKQQRFSLNDGKTKVWDDLDSFVEHASNHIDDRPLNELEERLLAVIRTYTDGDDYAQVTSEEIDYESVAELSEESLEALVEGYASAKPVEWSRIGWLLRRLRQVAAPGGLRPVLKRLRLLAPVIGDAARYVLAASARFDGDPRELGSEVISLLGDSRFRNSEYIATILIHLFAENAKLNHVTNLTAMWKSLPQSARREVLLAAAAAGATDWLRERKDDVDNADPWVGRALIASMSRLSPDEAKFWIKNKRAGLNGLDLIVAAKFFDGIHRIGVGGDLRF